MRTATRLLDAATSKRVRLRVGEFGGQMAARSEGLCLEGPEEGGVFQRPERVWFRLPVFMRKRCLLINRHHPTYQAQVVAAAEDVLVAAFGRGTEWAPRQLRHGYAAHNFFATAEMQ